MIVLSHTFQTKFINFYDYSVFRREDETIPLYTSKIALSLCHITKTTRGLK